MSGFDEDVFRAVAGATVGNPIDAAGILAGVDAYQRLLLTEDELNQSLKKLIGSGRVKEVTPGLYAEGNDPSRTFHPVSGAAYREALERYRKRFLEAADTVEDDCLEPIVRVRWRLRHEGYADDETEREIERLAGRLDEVLEGRAEGLGFELGPGVVDLVLAVVGSSDPMEVADRARSVLESWPAPPGSAVVFDEPSRRENRPVVPSRAPREVARRRGAVFEEGPMRAENPDWILVESGGAEAIEEEIRSYFSLSEPDLPVTTAVSLTLLPDGRCAIRFEPALPPYAFTNLVNWLDRHGAVGWFTSRKSRARYLIRTDDENPRRDTALALSDRGKSFEIYLPETSVTPKAHPVTSVREPLLPESAEPSRRFEVIVEADPSFGNPDFSTD
jgi:hypothetical protein